MEQLLNNFTTAIGWSILHSLWQGAALYTILRITFMMTPNLSARHKYNASFLGQVILLGLFISTFLYYINIPALFMKKEDLETYIALAPYLTDSQNVRHTFEILFPWFTSLYIIGLLIQLVVFSNGYSRMTYLRRKGLSDTPIAWTIAFEKIKSSLSIQKDVGLFLSTKISVPLTIGHFKPIVLFPFALANQMDLQQVEAILLHELAHIKRNDYLYNLVNVVIETLLFFNPFVWLLTKHIQTEREHACDDVVVTHISSPITYAQALFSLQTLKEPIAASYAMAATGKQQQHLLHRIKRITKMEKKYTNIRQHLVALGLSTLAFTTIAWIAPEKNPHTDLLKECCNDSTTVKSNDTILSADTTTNTTRTEVFVQDTTKEKIIKNDSLHIISPELAERLNKLTDSQAQKIEAYYNSPEWKAKITKIEEKARDAEARGREIEAYYNSPEWKAKIAKIEEKARDVKARGKEIEAYYNSPEWKAKIAKIEENATRHAEAAAKHISFYYSSPEWKSKVTKIEENAARQAEAAAKKIEIYYNSPEWEAKINDITAKSITITTDVLESLDLKNFNINMDGLPVPPKKKDRTSEK